MYKTKKKGSTQDRALMTVAVRPTQESEVKLLDNLCKLVGEKSYSGALMEAAKQLPETNKIVKDQQKEIETLQMQVKAANQILNMINTGNVNLAIYAKKFMSGKHLQLDLM